jgi:glycosyltransferase involved in cell wall biosynthesis
MAEISIIISAYKSEQFIRPKIKNILETEGVDYEIIIIDCRGGADIKPVEDILPENTIKIVHPKRITIWKAVNEGIEAATTSYVVQANTDDLVDPSAYAKQFAMLDEHGCDISYFDYYIRSGFSPNYSEAIEDAYTVYKTPEKYSTGFGLGPFPMWRKLLHEKYGLLEDKLEIFADSLFWDKLAKDPDVKWGHIPEKLGVYAQRAGENLESNQEYAQKDSKLLKRIRKENHGI